MIFSQSCFDHTVTIQDGSAFTMHFSQAKGDNYSREAEAARKLYLEKKCKKLNTIILTRAQTNLD